jgi:hypothetical protein
MDPKSMSFVDKFSVKLAQISLHCSSLWAWEKEEKKPVFGEGNSPKLHQLLQPF